MRALSTTSGSRNGRGLSALSSRCSESAHSPYFPASYKLTTRASSAVSLRCDPTTTGARVAPWACSCGAYSTAASRPTLEQKRDRLIRAPQGRLTYDPGMLKSRPGLSVTSNSFGGRPLSGGDKSIQWAWRAAVPMRIFCWLGTVNEPSSPQLALVPGTPWKSISAGLNSIVPRTVCTSVGSFGRTTLTTMLCGATQHSSFGGTNSKVCAPTVSSCGGPNQTISWPSTLTVAFFGPSTRTRTVAVSTAAEVGGATRA